MDREDQNEPSTVGEILRKIEEKADKGKYIYRGEPEHYQEKPYCGKVSSNLYRVFLEDNEFDVESEHFDVEIIQAEMLRTAKLFARKTTSEVERLAEIQHYGGKTNLIDFTEDYLVALFMACDTSLSKDGRIIMQEREIIASYIKDPYEPMNRIVAQRSIFVRHPDGFIQPNQEDIINIPASLKKSVQEHLERSHGVSAETIYNDIHGFIRHQSLKLETYRTIYKGLAQKQKGDSEDG